MALTRKSAFCMPTTAHGRIRPDGLWALGVESNDGALQKNHIVVHDYWTYPLPGRRLLRPSEADV